MMSRVKLVGEGTGHAFLLQSRCFSALKNENENENENEVNGGK
jgi:hypothetical protein